MPSLQDRLARPFGRIYFRVELGSACVRAISLPPPPPHFGRALFAASFLHFYDYFAMCPARHAIDKPLADGLFHQHDITAVRARESY